jgi:hypothetical protein
MSRRDTVRGCIIIKWQAAGSEALVEYEKVLAWAKECCNDFSRRGLNPAPEFIDKLKRGNEKYVKTWLKGCRFPFRIVDEFISTINKQQVLPASTIVATPTSSLRVCLKCGRINLMDAIFCSYCGQTMPR